MKEHPILFSGPMVRAILEGRKTQTRRVLKHQPIQGQVVKQPYDDGIWQAQTGRGVFTLFSCPYGLPGDHLWVKETWKPCFDDGSGTACRADRTPGTPEDRGPWKPSIFMSRRRSRLTLDIASVRVERLQSISETEAEAEGAERGIWCNDGVFAEPMDEQDEKRASFRHGYGFLWESMGLGRRVQALVTHSPFHLFNS